MAGDTGSIAAVTARAQLLLGDAPHPRPYASPSPPTAQHICAQLVPQVPYSSAAGAVLMPPGRRSAAGPAGDTAEVLALPARQEHEEGRICPQRIGPRGLTVRRPPGVAASFTATTTGLPAGRGAAGTQGLNPASAITFPSLNRLREKRAKERGSALPALPTKINSPSVSPRLRLMACDRAS